MKNELTTSTVAMIAGISILLMALAAGFAVGYVNGNLILMEDAASTLSNISQSQDLFRFGMFSWLVILICDLLAAWSLFILFKPINTSLSLLSAWFRLVYAGFLGIALLNYVYLLLLIQGNIPVGNESGSLADQIMFFLYGFQDIWSMGLVVFGIHLLGLGYLCVRSRFVPKLIGILIMIAAIGYVLIHLGDLILLDFDKLKSIIEVIFMLPMILGELGLGIWLLIRRNQLSIQ